jgi:hypothetical protein
LGIHTGAITAVSLPSVLTSVGQGQALLEGLTLGVVASERLTVFNTKISALRAASPVAQVETKWVVGYHDNTEFFDPPTNAIPNIGYQKPFTFEIPTADYSLLDDGSEELDLTPGTPGGDFKTWFDGLARSPYGGQVVLDYIRVMS